MTREDERVEREWFRLTREWRYAGRLELSVLYVRKNFILNSFIYIEPMKKFKYRSDMVKLGSFSDGTSSRLKNKNGVKQGGILSPVLFCVYIDGLLDRLAKCHVGCYIGPNFLGALAYADDIVLLASTPSAIRKLLYIRDDYAREYSLVFNGQKSK